MTPKQMHTELSKIAGHNCGDDRPFILSKRVTKAHIEIVQQRIIALLEKLNYDRTQRDFRGIYRRVTEERSSRSRMLRAERLRQRIDTRPRISGSRIVGEQPGYATLEYDDGSHVARRGGRGIGTSTPEMIDAMRNVVFMPPMLDEMAEYTSTVLDPEPGLPPTE